jgi:hypothetical protein
MKRLITICCIVIGFTQLAFAQEPANHVTGFTVGTVGATSIQLNWTGSVGPGTLPSNYLIVAKKTTGGTFAVPADGDTMADDLDFTGAGLNGAVNVVHGAGANTYTFLGLDLSTSYDFLIYPYTNTGSRNYLTAATVPSATAATANEPANHPTGFTAGTITSTSIQLSWTGSVTAPLPTSYLIVAKKNVGGTYATVSDGAAVADDSDFTGGGLNGAINVSHVPGTNTYTWTGLDANTLYDFQIYPYTGSGATADYKNTAAPTASGTTLNEPSNHVTAFTNVFATTTATQISLSWTGSAGGVVPSNYLILVRNITDGGTFAAVADGAAVADDADLTNGNGAINVAHSAGANSYNFTGLTTGKRYEFIIYPYNTAGSVNPDFRTAAVVPTVTAWTQPSVQATSIVYSNITNTTLDLSWSAGTGHNTYLVVAKQGGSPTAPTDGTTYTANTSFSTGQDVGANSYVIYKGTATTTSVTNLTANTSYTFHVFAFNTTSTGDENYITGNGAANNPLAQTTTNEPTNHVTAFTNVFASTTATAVHLTWTGSALGTVPTNYLIQVRSLTDAGAYAAVADGAAVADDADLTNGNGSINVAHAIGANSYTYTGLTAGKRYEFRIIPYNTAGSVNPNFKTDGSIPTATAYTEPSAQATAIVVSNVTNNTLDLSWSAGTGHNTYLVVGRLAGAPVAPTDGTTYTASSAFGTGTDIGSGSRVLYKGAGTTVSVTNLQSNGVYTFHVFAFNTTTDGDENYIAGAGASNNPATQTTFNEPSNHVTAFTNVFGTTTATAIQLSWTGSTGTTTPSNYLIQVRSVTDAGAFAAVADGSAVANDADLTNGNGAINVVHAGGANTYLYPGLTTGKQYEFRIFAYNATGNLTPDFKTDGSVPSVTAWTQPSVQATGIVVSNLASTSLTLTWSAGTGNNTYLVVARAGGAPTAPTDGTTYTANSSFSTGQDVGSSSYVIYKGNALTTPVTNLSANTSYTFHVFAFNTGTNGDENYITGSGAANNPLAQTTLNEPANHVTALNVTRASGDITVSFTGSTGTPAATNYMVLGRNVTKGASHKAGPADGTLIANDADLDDANPYNAAQQVAHAGGTISYAGWINENDLDANDLYEFVVYPYNTAGSPNPNYKTDGTIPVYYTEPTTSPTVALNNETTTSIDVTITGVTGAYQYLVVRRSGATPVSDNPADKTQYTVGGVISSVGQVVVYDGPAATFTDAGLSSFTQYQYAVFAYGGTASNTQYNYNTTEGTAATTTLCAPPGTAATAFTAGAVTSSTATVSWTRGNGNSVIVFAREGANTSNDPTSGTAYTASTVYGSGDNIPVSGEDWFCVYNGTGTSVTVTGLASSTAVAFKIYEYATIGTCYNTSAELTGTHTTASASSNSTIQNGSGATTISSLVDNNPAFTDRSAIFTFDIVDDGASPGADANETQFTAFTIRTTGSNNVGDLRDLIASADLYSDENAAASTTNNVTATINIDNIAFSGLTTGNNEIGEVDDNETKTYTVQIWFKTTPTGGLPATMDGKILQFNLAGIAGTNFTMAAGSGFLGGTNTSSNAATVQVVATKINTNTAPSTSAIATVDLAQQPIYEATDALNNRDLDFDYPLTVNTTNPNNLGPNGAPNFVDGLATFTTFDFLNTGTSTMSVTANSLTSANSAAITVSASTAVAQVGNSLTATNGISSSPLNSASTNHAVLGFSLTTTGSTLSFTGLTVTTSSDPDVSLESFELYESADNDFATANTNLNASSVTTPGNSIVFSGFTSSISSATKYYFVKANVKLNVSATTPAIQLTLTPNVSNLLISSGSGVTGGAFSGLNYLFLDVSPPTILSMNATKSSIFGTGADLVQTVSVVFSETMSTAGAFTPDIFMNGGNWGSQAAGSWSTTTLLNDTYTTTFTHTGALETANDFAFITSPSGARDLTGNDDVGGGTSNTFLVDTDKPDASVAVTIGTIYQGSLTQTVTVTYNEEMNPSVNPTITFTNSGNFTPSNAGAWSANGIFPNRIWTRSYVHDGDPESTLSQAVVATTSGAKDVAGNTDIGASSANFFIDTDRPQVTSQNSLSADASYTTANSVNITLTFDEAVFVTGTPTLTLNTGATATYSSGNGTATLSFTYLVGVGENTTDLSITSLNLPGISTIRDAVTNDAILTQPNSPNRLQDNRNIIIDTTAPTITSVSSTAPDLYYNAGDVINIQVAFTEPVFVTGAPQLALNSGGIATYFSGSGSSTLTFQYTVASGQNTTDLDYSATTSLTLPGGSTIRDVVSINATLTLATPGAANSISDDQAIIIDTILPTVSTITIDPATPPLNGIGSSQGTILTTLTYTVTFSEPVLVTSVDATDFNDRATGFAGYGTYPAVNGSVSAPVAISPSGGYATSFTVSVTSLTGTGRLYLDLVETGTIHDRASNDNTAAFTTSESYQRVLAEPTNQVTSPGAVSISPSEITVSWVNASSGQLPTHLVIVATGPDNSEAIPTPFVPADGTVPTAEEVFSNGNGLAIVDLVNFPTKTSHTFNNLRSGKSYDFDIYAYTLSPNNTSDNANFKLTAPAETSETTETANSGAITAGSTSAILTISSLQNASYHATPNFTFKIQDDGLNATADDAKMLINQMIIGTTGSTSIGLNDIIEEAQLIDITENNTVLASGSAITASTITFTLATTNDKEGEFDNDEIKEYQLRIRLKNPMTAAIAAMLDNERIEFYIDGNSFLYDANSSRVNTLEYVESDPTDIKNNLIDVDATKLNFTTLPPTNIYVLQPMVAVSTPPDNVLVPVVRAQDPNGNTDEDYTSFVTISNTGTIPMLGLNSVPAANTLYPSAGVVYFPANFRYADDGNGSLTVSGAGLTATTNGGTTTVDYSTSTVIADPTTSVAQGTISSLIVNAAAPQSVFNFEVKEDNNSGGDSSPTRITSITIQQGGGNEVGTWGDAIQGAYLTDNATWGLGNQHVGAVTGSTITFTGMSVVPGAIGYITDNLTKTYYLWIYLESGMAAPTLIDQQNLVFTVSDLDLQFNTLSSGISTSSAATLGTQNMIDVQADRLRFIVQPNDELLVDTDIINQQTPPSAEAVDVYGNRDHNFTGVGDPLTVTNGGGLAMTNAPTQFTTGLVTFSNTFQYDQVGDGTLILNAPGVTGISSEAVLVRVGKSGTITVGAGAEQLTISSLVDTDGEKQMVFDFEVNDDPGLIATHDENDGVPMRISDIVISSAGITNTIPNWNDAIAVATLSDDNSSTPVTGTISLTGTTITFSGIPNTLPADLGYVGDGGTKTYRLNIYLRTALLGSLPTTIDGLAFGFQVTAGNINTVGTGSKILDLENENSGANNEVTVVATTINYSQLNATDGFITPYVPTLFPAEGSINTNFSPRLGVEAQDVNENRDLDFNGTITNFATVNGLTFVNPPTGAFTQGWLKFPTNFQYTSGNEQDGQLKMTATDAGLSITLTDKLSPNIIIRSSFETIMFAGGGLYNIDYINYRGATISNFADGQSLIDLYVYDGYADVAYNDAGAASGDSDGAVTNISGITFGISNRESIKKAALFTYDYNTAVYTKQAEVSVSASGYGPVTFSSLNINAPDNDLNEYDYQHIILVATFNETPSTITDNAIIEASVLAVVTGGGSKFRGDVGDLVHTSGFIGGQLVSQPTNAPVPTAAGPLGNAHTLEVTATRLDFLNDPAEPSPLIAGIDQPLALPVVHARDAFQVVDLDYDINNPNPAYHSAFAGSAGAGLLINSFPFAQGVIDFTGLQYTSVGDGTLTIGANGLSSASGGSDPCAHVDVIHVNAQLASGGVSTALSLIGGANDVPIFGVTFGAPYTVAGQPKLQDFIITFANNTAGDGDIQNTIDPATVLVYESIDPTLSKSTDENLSVTNKVTITFPTFNTMKVHLNTPKDFSTIVGTNKAITYFILVDIKPTVNANTPDLQAQVLRFGYNDAPTMGNIVLSEGSSYANVTGNIYQFIDITPPLLVSSNPANGQQNFQVSGQTIDLTFSEGVKSLDGIITLYDRLTNTEVATLTLVNCGTPPCFGTDPNVPYATTLSFKTESNDAVPVPYLQSNTAYYIKIGATSIQDNGGNEFAGIDNSSALGFKTSNLTPPNFVGVPGVTNITLHGSDVTAQMDQPGLVYFMIVDPLVNTAMPTKSEIVSGVYAGHVYHGSFGIAAANVTQYGSIPSTVTFVDGNTYDIYLYGENDRLPSPGVEMASVVKGTSFVVTDPPGSGIILNGPESLNICVGEAQTIYTPITITERANSDFNGGAGIKTMNLLAPNGFVFSSTLPMVSYSGADFSSGTVSYTNNTILKLSFTNSTSTSFDRITITGLTVIADEEGKTGTISRLGGNALLSIADGTAFGGATGLISYREAEVTFVNDISPQTIIGNDNPVITFSSVADPVNPDFGPDVYSGPGVIDDALYTNISGVGTFPVTLTHTYLNGCQSTKTELYTIYDASLVVDGLETQYCTDAAIAQISGNVGPGGAAGYFLQNLRAYILRDKVQILDSLKYNNNNTLNLPVASLVQSAQQFDAATATNYYNYTFDPQVFDLAVFYDSIRARDGVDGGSFIGEIQFEAEYYNVANYTTVKLLQNVRINLPPIAAFEITEAGPNTPNVYCVDALTLDLRGTPQVNPGETEGIYRINNLTTFPGLTDENTGNAVINTAQAANGHNPLTLSYTYTVLESGCTSTSTTPLIGVDNGTNIVPTAFPVIKISPNPVARMTHSLPCDSLAVDFNASTSGFNGTVPASSTISRYDWNFGDATNSNNTNNKNELKLPQPTASHTFITPTLYNTTLTVVSNDGCTSPVLTTNVDVAGVPVVNFAFAGVSTKDTFFFNANASTIANDQFGNLAWNFGDGKPLESGLSKIVSHTYDQSMVTTAILTVTGQKGCSSADTLDVVVLPYVPMTSGAYIRNFNDDAGWKPWTLDNKKDSVSWGYDAANGIWRTGVDGTYSGREESALYSPAFNFSAMERPIISFKNFVRMHASDGVVLEYSTDARNIVDPNKVWTIIGTNESGIDWYNQDDLASSPGNQTTGDYGWSGTGSKTDNLEPPKWREAKHSLSAVIGASRVVFRFALASQVNRPQLPGFALDDVRIGNGTRTVLIENFTNASTNSVVEEDNFFKKFPVDPVTQQPLNLDGVELVKIDYHVAFPGVDPINEENPSDPGARALYYNVGTVPHTRMDGNIATTPGPKFSEWGLDEFEKRVLDLATIEIKDTVKLSGSELTIEGTFKALENIAGTTLLHIAIVEKEVNIADNGFNGRISSGHTDFKYVLRKMLPSAAGRPYTDLVQDAEHAFKETFELPGLLLPEDNLAVIIFLQQADGEKRVYQAHMYQYDIQDPADITAVDAERMIGIYPNPADKEILVELAVPVKERTPLRMYDQMGKMVREMWLEKGETTKTLVTQDYAAGMYLVQVETPIGLVRKKVIVLHEQ